MTVTGAEKAADAAGHKEKVVKRRALGRGLESLLPGPRVVVPQQAGGAPQAEGGGSQQIPHRAFGPVRNDNAVGDLQGVVEETATDENPAPAAGPLLAKDARSGAPMSGPGSESENPRPTPTSPMEIAAQEESRIPSNLVVNIPLDAIDKNPYQTRLVFEEEALRDLAASIGQSGVVQPVVVRPSEKEGRYVLVLGERRVRASKLAGRQTIAAIVRRVSELQAAELTIVENMQREDLNCLEQAEAFRVLSKNFNLTQAQIAEKVGVSRESVSNYMRLLKLPHAVQEYLKQGGLGFSEAMVLLQLEDEEQVEKLAATAVEKSLNVEQIRDAVMRLQGYDPKNPDISQKAKTKGGARWVDPNVRSAQNDLQRLLGMRVRIRDKKGKGTIVIDYASVDDYERVVGMLRKQ